MITIRLKIKMKAVKLLFLFVLVGLMACGDDEGPNDSEIGYDQTMVNYMDAKGWDGLPTIDGMYYVIIEPGTAEKPTSTSTVEVNYKGYFSDDVEFDSGDSIRFNLGGALIEGWKIGIPKFGLGGKGHLLIPPNLGYGEFPTNGIRNQSILIFDVELLDF